MDLQSGELPRLLIETEALARVIREVPIPPQIRRRIDALNILRAVRGTTGIEGVDLSEAEVRRVLDAKPGVRALEGKDREEAEVQGARGAYELIASLLRDDPATPLTEGLIGRIHEVITGGIDYPHNVPGRYRHHGVSAGDYVPPRENDEVCRLMAEYADWLVSPRVMQWPALVRAVAAHFYFISIHPFGDGNGRTARAIESFLLYQGKLNALGFYSLSNFYYLHRDEYVAMLDFTRFSSGHSLTELILFAARGLVVELNGIYRDVLDAATLVAFRDYCREVMQSPGRTLTSAADRQLRLLMMLDARPVPLQDVRRGAHPVGALYNSLSSKTFSRDVAELEHLGLLMRADNSIRLRLEVMNDYKALPT